MPQFKRCKCGNMIEWIENPETGRAIPIDAKPITVYRVDADGKVELVKGVRLNHFISCPKRDEFRKPRTARRG